MDTDDPLDDTVLFFGTLLLVFPPKHNGPLLKLLHSGVLKTESLFKNTKKIIIFPSKSPI